MLETLASVLHQLPARAVESKVTCEDAAWDAMIEELSLGVPVGYTVRSAAKCNSYRGKPLGARAKRHFCVWITRRDDGRYEYGCNT